MVLLRTADRQTGRTDGLYEMKVRDEKAGDRCLLYSKKSHIQAKALEAATDAS